MKKKGRILIIPGIFLFLLFIVNINPISVSAQKRQDQLPGMSDKAIIMPCSSDLCIVQALILALKASKVSGLGEHYLSLELIRKAKKKLEQAEECLCLEALSAEERKSKNEEIKRYRRYFEEFEEYDKIT